MVTLASVFVIVLTPPLPCFCISVCIFISWLIGGCMMLRITRSGSASGLRCAVVCFCVRSFVLHILYFLFWMVCVGGFVVWLACSRRGRAVLMEARRCACLLGCISVCFPVRGTGGVLRVSPRGACRAGAGGCGTRPGVFSWSSQCM